MIAKELISASVVPLKPDDTASHALSVMEELNVRHLPVVNASGICALISEKELMGFPDPDWPLVQCGNAQVMDSAGEGQHLYDVIRLFAGRDLTLLPVVNDKNQYLGSITRDKLVAAMAEMAAISQPGGIIVLDVNEKDYQATEIAQIVESNDAKILSLYIKSHPDSTKLEVTLKINRLDIGPIMQTFFRYNYTVSATWSHEDAYSDGLQDRFDALMNYLNI